MQTMDRSGDGEGIALVGLGRWGGGVMLKVLSAVYTRGIIHGVARSNYAEWTGRQNLAGNFRIHDRGELENILMDPGVKAVIIATRFDSHFALVKQALLAGKDVLVEKPFTPTLEEAMELTKTACDTGRLLAIGYEYVHDANIRRLAGAIAGGDLAAVSKVELVMLNPGMGRALDRSSNVIEDLASHLFSLVCLFFGAGQVEDLKATMDQSGERARIDFRCGGVEICVIVDRDYQAQERKRTITVSGDRLAVTLDYQNGVFNCQGLTPDDLVSSQELLARLTSGRDSRTALEMELTDFLDAVDRHRPVVNNAAMGVWVTDLICRIEGQLRACRT